MKEVWVIYFLKEGQQHYVQHQQMNELPNIKSWNLSLLHIIALWIRNKIQQPKLSRQLKSTIICDTHYGSQIETDQFQSYNKTVNGSIVYF